MIVVDVLRRRQNQFPQGKLISVISGKIFDVAVDIRKESSTYKKYITTITM